MKKQFFKGVVFSVAGCIVMTICGCSKQADNIAAEENENTSATTEDYEKQNEVDYTNTYFANKDGIVYKYIVTNGKTETQMLTKSEIEELQLEDLRENRILVWQDSFNSEKLNTDIWGFEEGHLRNNEVQFYVSDDNNLSIKDGELCFVAKHEKIHSGYDWSSASIYTKGSKQFCKGRIEAKIKTDNVKGLKAKFWASGVWGENVWPQKGQIDICELSGNSNKYLEMAGNVYYAGPNLDARDGYGIKVDNFIDSEYHIYALEWSEDAMELYIDDTNVATFTSGTYEFWNNCNPFRLPQFLRLNLAVSSALDNKSKVTDEEKNTDEISQTVSFKDMNMYVDWVRVYALPKVDKALQLVPNKISIDYLWKVGKADKITFSDMEYTGSIGDTIYLGAVYLPQTVVERSCEYSVDNEAIATIEQDGRLTVNSGGTVTVTVKDMLTGVSGQRKIKIKTE